MDGSATVQAPASNQNNDLSPLQKAAMAVKELRGRLDAVERAKREPIAIVGMGCRFPGADGLDAYWKLLSEGIDAVTEVPAERWDLAQYFDKNPNAPGKISTRFGGFLDKVDEFDAAFFGISPHEAERLDPQQRLLLEVTWHALEDAGQSPAELRGSRTGVFVGITQNDYGVMQLGGPAEDIQAYTGTGNGFCFTAGRLAYVLGLNGPAFAVDTACSSSLVALHQASSALRNGECDLAIVAGVQLNLTPAMQVFLSKTQSFSPDGRCRTFDESANGFVLGEGVGVLILRRESDATHKGENIRALVRATGINHDGPSSGLTVPNESAQEALIREVIQSAKLSPDAIDYIETHGTATELGDPIEVGALRSVFGERAASHPLMIGSVKTNLGHLSAAAGVAGLIKVVLMLEHEKVAPNLHFTKPSSRIPWNGFSVRVPDQIIPWPRQERLRRAGVSSFGLSGTNAHVLLEEAPASAVTESSALDRSCHIFTLSARTPDALSALADSYANFIAQSSAELSLADIAYSANTGRSAMNERVAIVADSKPALIKRLRHVSEKQPSSDYRSGQVPKGGVGRIAFVFDAQIDIEWVRALAAVEPTLAENLAACSAAYLNLSLNDEQQSLAEVFAAQWAFSQLLARWGITPEAVAGSGVGILTARCLAGMLTIDDAFQLIAGHAIDLRSPQMSLFEKQAGGKMQALAFQAVPNYTFANAAADPFTSEAFNEAGYAVTVELGGRSGVRILDSTPHTTSTNDDVWYGLLDLLSSLFVRGVTPNWAGFDASFQRQRVRLPLYAFQRQRFWLEMDVASNQAANANPIEMVDADTITSPTVSASVPVKSTSDPIAALLRKQLESASVAINDVVSQQLEFLRGRVQPSSTTTSSVESRDNADVMGDFRLLRLSANDEAGLEDAARAWFQTGQLEKTTDGTWRKTLVYRDHEDAGLALGLVAGDESAINTAKKRVITAQVQGKRSLVFSFPGVGDHYLNMAQGLYQQDAVFRQTFDQCCQYLRDQLNVDLHEVVYPPQALAQAEAAAGASSAPPKLDLRAMLGRGTAPTDPNETRLNQTIHSQPLVFIVEYALGKSWLSRGLRPDAMIGYSIGEYTAACLAGVIDVEDVLRLITQRAQLIQALPHGVMLAVPLSEQRLLPLLGDDLSLCIVSTPNQCIVGGPEEAIHALELQMRKEDIVTRRLPGTHAFHSSMLAPLHNDLVELVKGFELRAPTMRYVSNVTGDWIRDDQATDPEYWAKHTWQTVRFADGVALLLEEGRVFLEVGPGQSLGSFVLQHPVAQGIQDKIVLPSLRNRYEQSSDETFFLNTLGKLWLAGVAPGSVH